MKLEVGKKYVCRNGEVVGPLEKKEPSNYPFFCPQRPHHAGTGDKNFWREDGSFSFMKKSPMDIVSEYTEPAPPLQWKWMKPDRPGIWMFGGYQNEAPDQEDLTSFTVHEGKCQIRTDPMWCCFICDIPVIALPEKKKVIKKRLYVRRERAPLDCSPPEIEHRWEPVNAAVKLSEWKSTELIEEFEE